MTARNIVKIDEEKCTGCGDCVPACAEGAIQIIDGVAKLKSDNLCDGLGACLGDCPVGAITIEVREADDFDEAAVAKHMAQTPISPPAQAAEKPHTHHGPLGGCPGARVLQFDPPHDTVSRDHDTAMPQPSMLRQWPVQLHLIPPTAPYFHKADVVLAADCVAYSVGDFHGTWLKDKALAIACPKLDSGQESYLEKLVSMIDDAEINTLTVMVMEVPCCSGLLRLAKEATARAGRRTPIKHVVVGVKGDILNETWV